MLKIMASSLSPPPLFPRKYHPFPILVTTVFAIFALFDKASTSPLSPHLPPLSCSHDSIIVSTLSYASCHLTKATSPNSKCTSSRSHLPFYTFKHSHITPAHHYLSPSSLTSKLKFSHRSFRNFSVRCGTLCQLILSNLHLSYQFPLSFLFLFHQPPLSRNQFLILFHVLLGSP